MFPENVSVGYFAAMRRMQATCGESRKSETGPPGYYSLKIVAALNDPSTAGPRLARAIKLWPGQLPACWTETGELIPEGFDVWVRQQRTWMDAIDDDDEAAEREQTIRRLTASPYLLAEEAREYLGLKTLKALYHLVERGKLRKLPGSYTYRFTRQMLDDYLNGKPKGKKS